MENIRVRFAPSPTGALHIGGIRTALYNYLLAKKHGGTFILRIEDTDQTRYVPGAENYILEALSWCGLQPDEGPGIGGEYGPYRQSERKEIYQQYAQQLLDNGYAYYAFDTPEELNAYRQKEKEAGNHNFKYDSSVRHQMNNSLSLTAEQTKAKLASKEPYTIRLKVPEDEIVRVNDIVRGEVAFQSNELDDKVLMKGDGMPTYHMANIVDDYLMKISHVIRGEEWLPSTAHHVLLYRFLGWEDQMPQFAHLPLILKPNGNGKLSKRAGAQLGIPVFPLEWKSDNPEDSFAGFREFGFDPRAVTNFLAFLGWNPGTEQEIFSMEELIEAFDIHKIGKAGAKFDFDKAKWYNQQYLIASDNSALAKAIRPIIESHEHHPTDDYLERFCGMMKERVVFYPDFWENGYYFFEEAREYDEKTLAKKWKPEFKPAFAELKQRLHKLEDYQESTIKQEVESFMTDHKMKYGDVLPILRIALSGTTKGPSIFEMMELFGAQEVDRRLTKAYTDFDAL
jgi:glutamyl-tRNA synthetase